MHFSRTYKSHGFMRPDRQFQASAVDDPRSTHCREQDQAHAADPRQDHAHRGHPAAIVLPVSDGVNDFEVTFERNDRLIDWMID